MNSCVSCPQDKSGFVLGGPRFFVSIGLFTVFRIFEPAFVKSAHKKESPGVFYFNQFMVFQKHRLSIPSNAEYSVPQLRMMIQQVEAILACSITPDEWNSLA
jgi:hypothetical protein